MVLIVPSSSTRHRQRWSVRARAHRRCPSPRVQITWVKGTGKSLALSPSDRIVYVCVKSTVTGSQRTEALRRPQTMLPFEILGHNSTTSTLATKVIDDQSSKTESKLDEVQSDTYLSDPDTPGHIPDDVRELMRLVASTPTGHPKYRNMFKGRDTSPQPEPSAAEQERQRYEEKRQRTTVVDLFLRWHAPQLTLYTDAEVEAHLKSIVTEESYAMWRLGECFMLRGGETKWTVARRLIDQEKQRRVGSLYEDPSTAVKCSSEEHVNGFQLYNVEMGDNLCSWELYTELCELLDSCPTTKWTRSQFAAAMGDMCCTEWNKQDIHGECYGGPWAQPVGSYAKENAWDLCMTQAISSMWRLPFPKDLLLETIRIGCRNRRESVRYSNFLCVWLERKRAAMSRTCTV